MTLVNEFPGGVSLKSVGRSSSGISTQHVGCFYCVVCTMGFVRHAELQQRSGCSALLIGSLSEESRPAVSSLESRDSRVERAELLELN
ncbi:hypothetical protein VZT92_006824 [Zoarces viviparus]|uniref:Uncharacterized protein n=1 Tax=Zoarces viviparus TaxID=48416 RepID=A0AAW1FR36_ZOAVI